MKSRILASACWVILMSLMIELALSAFAQANTTYIYVGNEYSKCQGSYCLGGPYALSVKFVTTLSGDELVNMPFTDITPTVISFEFTDGSGRLTVNQNAIGGYASFEISTDASGRIITWLVGGYANNAETQMQTNWNTYYSFHPGADFSETSSSFSGDYGFNSNNPGTWRQEITNFTTKQFIEGVYVAYWGRAADPEGLNYWEGLFNAGTLGYAGIAENFAISEEGKAAYAYFDTVFNHPENYITEGMRQEFVGAIYQNLFDRAPDAEGLAYWVGILSSGGTTPGAFIAAIINSAYDGRLAASADDWDNIDAKIQVAEHYTGKLSASGIAWSAATLQQAADVLSGITKNSDIATAKQAVDEEFACLTSWRMSGLDFRGSRYVQKASAAQNLAGLAIAHSSSKGIDTSTGSPVILVGDISGDQVNDIVWNGSVGIYHTTGNDLEGAKMIPTSVTPMLGVLNDINNDGALEIFTSKSGNIDVEINSYTDDGNIAWQFLESYSGDKRMYPAIVKDGKLYLGLQAFYSRKPRGIWKIDLQSKTVDWKFGFAPAISQSPPFSIDFDRDIIALQGGTVHNGDTESGNNNSGPNTTDGELWQVTISTSGLPVLAQRVRNCGFSFYFTFFVSLYFTYSLHKLVLIDSQTVHA
ncbi:MAG: DUF4214 domain-containing protein [Pseudomonadota bacterium]